MAEFASKGIAGTGLGLGIAGTALGVLNSNNGGSGILGSLLGNNGGYNRYDAEKDSTISELRAQIALRDANTYGDQKILEVYKHFDNKIEGINHRLSEQSVWNATQTGTIGCMAQQIAQLQSLTKLVVPNASVCPGWGDVTITPATATTA